MNPGASRNPFLRRPLVSLLLCLLACLPAFLKLGKVAVDSDARTLLEGDQRNLAAYEKVRAILNDEVVLVITVAGEEIFSQRGFDDLRQLCDAIAGVDGLVDVKSLTHSVKPVRKGFQFEFVPFVPRGKLDEAEIAKIRAYSVTHPLVKNIMVAPDAKHTILTCSFRRKLDTTEAQRAFRGEIAATIRPFEARGYEFKTVALPLVALEIGETVEHDVKELAAWLFVVVIALLWLALRSFPLLFLCLVNLCATLALLPALMAFLGVPLTFYSMMLFPLVAGIQLTLLAHLFMGASRARREGLEAAAAVARALARVLKSCAFASVTTMAGLVSLALCEVRQVAAFGVAGAAGVAVVFLWTFGPGVALLTLGLKIRAGEERELRDGGEAEGASAENLDAGVSSAWAEAVLRHRGRILVAGLAALALAVVGLARARTDIRVTEFLDRSSPTRVALQEFDEVYGGINVVQFRIDSGTTNGINQLPFLSYVGKVQAFADADPRVSGTYSYAQLLAMMNQIWEQEREGSLELPRNPLTLGVFALALKAQNFPFLAALADKDFRTATVIVRTRDMRSGDYLDLLRRIVDFAEKNRPEGVVVSAEEGIHSILEADRRIMDAQARSVALTLGVVGLTLTLLWRSVWLAGMALLANAIPVGLAMALAGFADLPLNSVTVMVGAIALSVAVDDSVHFITWWRDELRRMDDPREALASAFRIKGPPILFTSLILAAVFGLFLLFSFPPVRHFGMLSSAAFVGALISTLAFLPAMLRPAGARNEFRSPRNRLLRPSSSRDGRGRR